VIFDLDGVLLDSESVWHEVRRDYVVSHGGRWTEDDQAAVMGDNSRQWARYITENCGVALSPDQVYEGVVAALRLSYAAHLPLHRGAVDAVRRLRGGYVMAVASSSPPEIIEFVLESAGLRADFRAVVSSDEVPRGKPEPDVYLEACRRVGRAPERSVAVEDSSNGIRAALAAGLRVIAIPNVAFPPSAEVLGSAHVVLRSVAELSPRVLESLRFGQEVDSGR
jgi:HAD superfamily hydrolase (TIGR01509 family)